ncbi:hypothetical protein [Sphingomonas abietis]|uniref:Uncharacterized protein n=1 Tax=Sphingomonas abietis TaxID=3012344 RepID=A0ABY7NI29_9SPHN|nr:hypothetical protein [Sphingomonas abietis]WBO20988.1 hypothetical protein PBT88_12305 [Sphingomonas abietis]
MPDMDLPTTIAGVPVTWLRAATEIPYGSPVLPVHRGKACAIAFDLDKMTGVARRGGDSPYGYAPGEMVPIQTGGGIKAQLAVDTDLMIGGIQRRLLASEPHYFQLERGRIVG